MRRFVVERWKDILLVLAALALGLASQFWWLWHHHVPPEADYGLHLAEAAAFQAVAECPGNLAEKLVTLWTWPGPYPPMVYLVTWLVTCFLPSGSYAALASLSVFLVCLVTGAYILGSSAGGRVAGLMAALLVQVDPVIMSCMHRYWVDMPVAAMVVLSLALLHLSRGFTARGWSLALGACLACGMASKFTLCWFLTLPLLVAMVPPWWREGKRERLWFLGTGGGPGGGVQGSLRGGMGRMEATTCRARTPWRPRCPTSSWGRGWWPSRPAGDLPAVGSRVPCAISAMRSAWPDSCSGRGSWRTRP